MSVARRSTRCLLLGLLAIALPVAAALASPCDDAIRVVERERDLPKGLLRAIGLVESGRTANGGFAPWPWTVNSPEGGRYLESPSAVIQHIEGLRSRGHRNIDVGCMQINLRHHPDAFTSLQAAVDPLTNVRYAASFLVGLRRETGSWEQAIGRYHSATPHLASAYRERVAARWDPNAPIPAASPTVVAAVAPEVEPAVDPVERVPVHHAAAANPVRLAANVPTRAGHGAIAVVVPRAQPVAEPAPRAQPVAYAPMERLRGQASGALRPR